MNFFEHQAKARSSSRRLVVLFVLAVAGIVVAIDAAVLAALEWSARHGDEVAQGPLLARHMAALYATSLIVLATIATASLYKSARLRSGGGVVARSLGGTLITSENTNPDYRRLRNVVEEIAIASGVPVPELYVLEADAGDLVVGLPAELVIEAYPEHVHAATLTKIDTLAKPRHQDVPVQYFAVTLSLPATDPATMKVGQRVRATLVLEQGDAIVVPRQAVFERDGRMFVHRQDGARFEEVEVKLGSSSAGRVVITEGLTEGDRIALRDPEGPGPAAAEAKAEAGAGGAAKGGPAP